jgi:hypothetical protein
MAVTVANETPGVGEDVFITATWSRDLSYLRASGLADPVLTFQFRRGSGAWRNTEYVCTKTGFTSSGNLFPCNYLIHGPQQEIVLEFRAVIYDRRRFTSTAPLFDGEPSNVKTAGWIAAKQMQTVRWAGKPKPKEQKPSNVRSLTLTVNGAECKVEGLTNSVNSKTDGNAEVQAVRGDVATFTASYSTSGYTSSGTTFQVRLQFGREVENLAIASGTKTFTFIVDNYTPKIHAVEAEIIWASGENPTSGGRDLYGVICHVPVTFKRPPPPGRK